MTGDKGWSVREVLAYSLAIILERKLGDSKAFLGWYLSVRGKLGNSEWRISEEEERLRYTSGVDDL